MNQDASSCHEADWTVLSTHTATAAAPAVRCREIPPYAFSPDAALAGQLERGGLHCVISHPELRHAEGRVQLPETQVVPLARKLVTQQSFRFQ